MALNDTILNIGANAMAAAATHASLHTAAPDATGSNQSAAPRKSVPWAAASGGDLALSGPIAFTGGAASGPVTHVGLWSAASGGTFYGAFALTGDAAFNAAGEYNVTTLNLPGSAT